MRMWNVCRSKSIFSFLFLFFFAAPFASNSRGEISISVSTSAPLHGYVNGQYYYRGTLLNADPFQCYPFINPGDTNADGVVDVLDFANIMSSGLFDSGAPAHWGQGDFNADGIVDILDMIDLMGNLERSSPAKICNTNDGARLGLPTNQIAITGYNLAQVSLQIDGRSAKFSQRVVGSSSVFLGSNPNVQSGSSHPPLYMLYPVVAKVEMVSIITEPLGVGLHSVEVVDPSGQKESFLFEIRAEIPAISVAYPKKSAVYAVGSTIIDSAPVVTGGEATLFTVSPALPGGISIDSQTGIISGIPTQTSPQTTYTITAISAKGKGMTQITIEVLEPISLRATPGNQQINLAWNSISGAASYNLYWSQTYPVDVSRAERISGVSSPYVHRGLNNGQGYYYVITSVSSASGQETESSLGTGSNSAGSRTSEFVTLPQNMLGFVGVSGTVRKVLSSNGLLYLATSNGLAISSDGGANFRTVTTSQGLIENNLSSVAVSGAGVIVGSDNGLSLSNDGGVTFAPLRSFKDKWVNSVVVVGQTIYVGTSYCGFYISSDGGRSFRTVQAPSRWESFTFAVSGPNVYLAKSTGLSISVDGGATFRAVNGLGIDSISVVSALGSTVYVGTNGNGLFVSTDAGNTFRKITTTQGLASNYVRDIASMGLEVYVGTDKGLSFSSNMGNTFRTPNMSDIGLISWIDGVAAAGDKVFAFGLNQFFVSANKGNNFRQVKVLQSPRVLGAGGKSLYFVDDGDSNSPFYVISEDAKSISQVTNGVFSPKLTNVVVSAPRGIYLGTSVGLYYSSDGGKTVTRIGTGLAAGPINSIALSGLNVFAGVQGTPFPSGPKGGFHVSRDGGQTFRVVPLPFSQDPGDVRTVSVSGDNVYVGSSYGLAVSTDGGNSFRAVTSAQGLAGDRVDSIVVSGQTLYVGTQGGLSISVDGGNTFISTTFNGCTYNGAQVAVVRENVYLGTFSGTGGCGVFISSDGASTFKNRTRASGLANNDIKRAVSIGESVYFETENGISAYIP